MDVRRSLLWLSSVSRVRVCKCQSCGGIVILEVFRAQRKFHQVDRVVKNFYVELPSQHKQRDLV